MHKFRTTVFAILIAASSSLISCANNRSVDPRLEPYITAFEERYGVIYFGGAEIKELSSNLAGICEISKESRNIVVNSLFYDVYSDENSMEQLMYHELGHCLMQLDHTNNMRYNGCPESIMYYRAFGMHNCYRDNRTYYLDQLEQMWKSLRK